MTRSTFAFPKKIVVFVRCIINAPVPNPLAEPLPSARNHNNSPSRLLEHVKKPKRSKNSMHIALELKARFPWVSAPSTYAVPATWVWQKPVSNIFWSLVRLISPVWPGGSKAGAGQAHATALPAFSSSSA
jgi:hypothetical protein